MSDANTAERAFWSGAVGERWVTHEAMLERLHGGFIPPILAAAALKAGQQVLDIGCGTGALARAAAVELGPRGQVTGLDISPIMLTGAATIEALEAAAPIDWLEADAQTHPFPSGRYDAVISRMGVMFFDDVVAAFANLRAACAPGARFAAICWRSGVEAPWFHLGRAAVAEVLGPLPAADPHVPGPMAFADEARVIGLMQEAGWTQVACDQITLEQRPGASAADLVQFAARLGPLGRVLGDPDTAEDTKTALRAALTRRLAEHEESGEVVLRPVMNLFTAQA